MSIDDIASLEALLKCQKPMANLYTFDGKLDIHTDDEEATAHLTVDNLMLRGARLKDTEYVIGCAVYTGQETKLSLNTKISKNKFSTAERSINIYLLFFIGILLTEIIASATLKEVIEKNSFWDVYLGKIGVTSFYKAFVDALSFVILYNYVVPISLYVTIEMQKFISSFFFEWDLDMYDQETNQPAIANSSDLNEDLGQIEYLFTDKTGTLTENLMVFRQCYVGGNLYMENDCDGNLYLLPSNGDPGAAVKLIKWQPEIWHFLISISLCHVVHIAPPYRRISISQRRSAFRESFKLKRTSTLDSSLLMDPELPVYQAASADEKALVEASARCGVVFQKDSGDEIELKAKDTVLKFKKLDTLEFSSVRKRMSVIVQDSDGDLWLYCKGADSEMFPLIVKGNVEQAKVHVNNFSKRGLRTLVIGYKRLKRNEYDSLKDNIQRSREIIGEERTTRIQQSYKAAESDLTLIGVTAVEDRLQEGVEETLKSLQVAGIKIWILTGDKIETAENIARLCGHFNRNIEVLRLENQGTTQTCCVALTSFERRIKIEPYREYGLVMDGVSIAVALKDCPELLKSVAMSCDAVVCCRMTPLQKGEIVELIKNARCSPVTAAIGDGGNDISMIQTAHVGIGIIGREGRQAANSSDFAFTKFKCLKKALLVHGHWYYVRISTLTHYFFYKNFVFITPQLLYGIHNGFSTQALYDSLYLMLFNVVFTSAPVLIYGLLEQDFSASKLLHHPVFYQFFKNNQMMSKKYFASWIALGMWQTCVIYFVPYFCWRHNPIILYDSTAADQWAYSICIYHTATLVINTKILITSSHWTVPFVLSVVLSQVTVFTFAIIYSSVYTVYNGNVFWVFNKMLLSPTFWLLTLVTVTICHIPDFLIVLYNTKKEERMHRRGEKNKRKVQINSFRENHSSFQLEKRRFHLLPWRRSLSLEKGF
ncbi:probable phospholipid-transporting ATPase IF isoform X2 [Orussus abietinus]|nr:probable phospholipid-transporting ATPase IF isoform X2 [Orussus abietinus]